MPSDDEEVDGQIPGGMAHNSGFGGGNANIDVARTIKLPPFWKENPGLWFGQAVAISHITADATKYRYIIVNLDQTVLPFVSDVIAVLPAVGKYEAVKA